jgi:alkaline phosphatase D
VFAGDNVYASEQPFDVATLYAAYVALAAQANFARLRATIPHLAVWDDHDNSLGAKVHENSHESLRGSVALSVS